MTLSEIFFVQFFYTLFIMSIDCYIICRFLYLQINKNDIVNAQSTGTEAFRNAFLYTSYKSSWILDKEISRIYLEYIYNQFAINFTDDMCLKPMDWCMNVDISELIHKPVRDYDDHKKKCEGYLTKAGFQSDCNARSALRYAYFGLNASRTNGIASSYMKYMADQIFPHVEKLSIADPQKYCENIYNESELEQRYINHYEDNFIRRVQYCYEDCINEFTMTNGLTIDMSSQQIYQYAYQNLSDINIKGRNYDILIQYFNDLSAIVSSYYEVLDKLTDWCSKYRQTHFPNALPGNFMNICQSNVGQASFHTRNERKKNLKRAFFTKTVNSFNRENNQIAKAYYEYMLERILPFVDRSGALGPQQYCAQYSLENTSGTGQRNITVNSPFTIDLNQPGDSDHLDSDPYATYDYNNQFSNTYEVGQSSTSGHNLPYIDFFQPGSSSTQDPYQDTNVNPLPGSSAGGNFLYNTPNSNPIILSSDEES